MTRLRYNGLATGAAGSTATLALGASLTSGATSVTFNAALTHSNGTAVPTIAGSDYIPLAILDANGHISEIVWLTAYTAAATTGTISRGQEGTSGVAHSSGDKIVCAALIGDAAPTLPLEPAAPLDHFPGNSLGGAWSFSGSYVSGDFAVSDSWLKCTNPRVGGHYVYRTPPGSWSQITAKMTVLAPTSGTAVGLLAVDGSGNGICAAGAWNGSPDCYIVGSTAGGVYSGTNANKTDIPGSTIIKGIPHWIRLRKSGTSYFASVSLNGVQWSAETTAVTSSATISRIGFGAWLNTAAPTEFDVDWFDAA